LPVKVSLGICVKNCEKTVGETITSIVNQDFPHKSMEAIVVNDGSTDGTLAVVTDLFSKTKIATRVYQGGGKGLGVVRQIVVDNAKGEYVVWVDDGLILPTDHVQKQVEFMDNNPKVGQARAKWGWYEKGGLLNSLENLMVLAYESEITSETDSSKLRGIGGSICRLDALRQVGGFDKRIKSSGEDIELSAKLKSSGWQLAISQAKFYYSFADTWKSLWRQNFSYGYGGHYVKHKHADAISLLSMFPVVGFFVGLVSSFRVYRLTRRTASFLLPIHFIFKRTAWFFGFLKSHGDGYGHPSL